MAVSSVTAGEGDLRVQEGRYSSNVVAVAVLVWLDVRWKKKKKNILKWFLKPNTEDSW
jgi:hypothetical protein